MLHNWHEEASVLFVRLSDEFQAKLYLLYIWFCVVQKLVVHYHIKQASGLDVLVPFVFPGYTSNWGCCEMLHQESNLFWHFCWGKSIILLHSSRWIKVMYADNSSSKKSLHSREIWIFLEKICRKKGSRDTILTGGGLSGLICVNILRIIP